MALVNEFEKSTKDRQQVHKPTRCAYSCFFGPDNKRYLTLDTFGSADREFPDKVSQTLQFDEQSAARLIQIIRESFPRLAAS
jgi:hypothetical protein